VGGWVGGLKGVVDERALGDMDALQSGSVPVLGVGGLGGAGAHHLLGGSSEDEDEAAVPPPGAAP